MLRPTKRSVFLFFIACTVTFFLGHRVVSSKPDIIDQCTSCLVYPFLLVQNKIITPLKQLTQRRHNAAQLQLQLDELHQQYEQLQADYTVLAASKHFMEEIDELRAFKSRYDSAYKILTKVLVKRLSNQEQTFLVDAGSYHGVKRNMVAVYKNNLIGRVVQVLPLYSKVTLITDRTCKIAAQCHDSGTTGIYEGCNQLQCAALRHVSHLAELQKNDLVFSSGQGLIFPQGFALGRVSSFEKVDLHYKVNIKPLVDVRVLEYCYLMEHGRV